MAEQDAKQQIPYRIIQLEWDAKKGEHNEVLGSFDDLVTHHPKSNSDAHLVNGKVVGGQAGRTLGVVGGEIQEIEVSKAGKDYGLRPDQVLLKKDFMLEDSRLPSGPASRSLDVPSPVAGVVGTVNPSKGLVDVLDREGGDVILRVRHMSPLHVKSGDQVEYGQALGVQSKQATGAIHVHMEVDSRYYQHYENYVGDLVSGRLSIDAERRDRGIEPRPFVDDGTIRIGESSEMVRKVQQTLNAEGYRGADNQPLQEDGVYRLSMQAAVINYQQAHGLSQTGDIDPATLQQIAPRTFPPELNREDHNAAPTYRNIQGAVPSQDPLHRQAEEAVRRLEQSLGRDYDDNSARLAASSAHLAKANGLTQIDHVVLSNQTASVGRGENVFVVQGALNNPAHLMAHMKTSDAIAQPVEQSLSQLQTLSETQRQQQAQQQGQQQDQQQQLSAPQHRMV
ncbi:peptidoglycan-binding protein [Xanthomonas campestris]|nr:XVIPCD domain-containing protein [Xanthomonas campestris]MCC5098481.1 peptidoglycan-binding protein [Xanthomonas campestris]RFF54558.1 peptidoglycan-binding protein [Xanthomonas campestris]RFF56048.1 peptidoglycan-binding protein [Xanthomonas campestris]WDI97911.1 peptidoglycan-binding protein [Xanthomonas campestris pv. incanae]